MMRCVLRFLCVFALGMVPLVGCGEDGGSPPSIELTIVSDNVAVDDRLATAWGYACVVRGFSWTILFDTGPDGTKLLANMEKLSLDAGALDLVFLSHSHADHIGGLVPLLGAAPPSDVYLLESFPPAFKDAFAAEGATVHEVTERERIIEQAHSLGPLGTDIPEQALVIDDTAGLIVVTGCAHPGIANIVATAREAFRKEVLLVMGGFHLFESTSQQIEEAVEALQQLGVQYVAPSHCTGDPAREAFARAFGSGYLSVGVGSTVTMADLAP
jgi:7,8-dihydropterin-6-yl-methyl-4-(beta-D-ribofuranosyl)aminobenzene 5'-phosphate synthase